jgi:hypothetical protein
MIDAKRVSCALADPRPETIMSAPSHSRARRFGVTITGALLASWVLSSTSTEARKVTIKTQHDKTFSFAGLKTWAWDPTSKGEVRLATTAAANPERLRERVEPILLPAIEREMVGRGFSPSTESPDVYVSYWVLVTVGQSSQQMGQFIGIPEWGLPPIRGATTAIRAYPVGTLLIDATAPSRRAVVWRGSAQAEIDLDRPDEERRTRLVDAVHRILEKFPPK